MRLTCPACGVRLETHTGLVSLGRARVVLLQTGAPVDLTPRQPETFHSCPRCEYCVAEQEDPMPIKRTTPKRATTRATTRQTTPPRARRRREPPPAPAPPAVMADPVPPLPPAPSAKAARAAGARLEDASSFIGRVTKELQMIAARDDESGKIQQVVGRRCGDFQLVATDGHRALLLRNSDPGEALPDPLGTRFATPPPACAVLPVGVHGALRRVRTCASATSHNVRVTVGATAAGVGVCLLEAWSPADQWQAAEWVALPAPARFGSVVVDARYFETGLGVWPIVFHYDPIVDGRATCDPVVFRAGDDAWRYIVQPMTSGASKADLATLSARVLSLPAECPPVDPPTAAPPATASAAPKAPKPATASAATAVGLGPSILWIGRTGTESLEGALADVPELLAHRRETPSYFAFDARQVPAALADRLNEIFRTLGGRFTKIAERWQTCRAALAA